MKMNSDWIYNEFTQVGKDYSDKNEVEVYNATHSDFRDIKQESLEVLKMLNPSDKDTLIDFGSGTGIFAIEAAKICRKVFAVDISKEMLEYSQREASKQSIENIEFHNSGFLNFRTENGSINYITSTFSLHHLPDYWKGIALERLNRMLVSNGILYIKDVIIESHNSLENIQAFINNQEKLGGDFLRDDAVGHFKEEFSTFDWIMDGLLERTGFEIQSKTINSGVIATYFCMKK